MAEVLDMVTAYRTAPHIDIIETKRKALDMLMKCLRCCTSRTPWLWNDLTLY